MKEKMEFRGKLNGILTLTRENGNQTTLEEIERYFEEEQLSKEQIELVCDYLLSQKVVVKGYEKTGGTVRSKEEKKMFSSEEQIFLREYLKDLSALKQEDAGEKEKLFGQAAQRDISARKRLTELYLKEVVEIAKEMHQPEMFLGDLVQEGNVGLLLAVEQITDAEHAHEVIVSQIRDSIQALIGEQTELKSRDKKMVEKVKHLDESIQSLTEELGRKVTVDELAVYMGMSEEEVEDILRLTGEDTDEEEEVQQ